MEGLAAGMQPCERSIGWVAAQDRRTETSGGGEQLSPAFVDVAVRRWERATGKAAVLDGCGRLAVTSQWISVTTPVTV